jgi:aspartate aminotransferase
MEFQIETEVLEKSKVIQPKTEFFHPLHNIEISPIVRIAEQARRLEPEFEKTKGEKFIHLERGEIDLSTPGELIRDINQALIDGKTKYPKSGGEIELKKAIAKKLVEKNRIVDILPEDVVVTVGGQEALNLAFQLFANKTGAGFSPIWSVAIENFVPYSNIKFLEIPFNEDFSIDYNALEDTLKQIEFLYINNPHNPTGKVFTYDELQKIVELCKLYNVFIISDEAYEDIVFDGQRHVSAASVEACKDYPNIISAYTYSKSFAATGLRVGYAASKNKPAITLINGAQYTHTAGVPTSIQLGLVNAYNIDLTPTIMEFERRRDALYNGLKEINGIKVNKPMGAFYAYPDFSEAMKSIPSNGKKELLDILLESGVCVVPGWAFTKNGHFLTYARLSYSAANIQLINTAVERLKKLFN